MQVRLTSKIDENEIRDFVQIALAELGHLEPGAFPMTQRPIVRGGKTCGYHFCLHGPRSVKLTAVCDSVQRVLYFYGTDGQRSHHLPLNGIGNQSRSAA